MSMFQIITQEGWTDFVVEVLRATDDKLVPFVAIYFVAYHLFVTLVGLEKGNYFACPPHDRFTDRAEPFRRRNPR